VRTIAYFEALLQEDGVHGMVGSEHAHDTPALIPDAVDNR
jgi:hypothetical protein